MPRGFSFADDAVSQKQLWAPSILRPNLWFSAEELSTISTSTGVSEWRDLSGNQNNATQATTSQQPDVVEVSINGKRSIQFTGSSNDLLSIGTALSYSGSSSAVTMFYTARFSATRIIGFGSDSNSCFASGNTFIIFRNSTDTGITATISSTDSNKWHVASARRIADTTSDAIVKLNGRIPTNGQGQISGTFQIDRIGQRVFGSPATTNQPSDGWLGELLAFSSALSDREMQLVEGYLAWRWGVQLAPEHPFSNEAPTIGD